MKNTEGPLPFCEALGRPWRVGDRVVVVAVEAPACRSGTIREAGTGGALVRHDDGEHMGPLGYRDLFGWSWRELEPEGN